MKEILELYDDMFLFHETLIGSHYVRGPGEKMSSVHARPESLNEKFPGIRMETGDFIITYLFYSFK